MVLRMVHNAVKQDTCQRRMALRCGRNSFYMVFLMECKQCSELRVLLDESSLLLWEENDWV